MNQKGNVLFLILIAVALFAALSFAMTNSSRTISNPQEESALVESSTIIQFGASISQAVNRMAIVRGVQDTDLCFYTGTNNETYNHAGCNDARNKIFHPQGGGVGYQNPGKDLNASLEWEFTANARLYGAKRNDEGDPDSADLLMLARNFNQTICHKINEKVGIDGIPVDFGDIDIFRFDGDYVGSDTIDGCNPNCTDIDASPFAARSANYGCFQEEATGDYIYFHLLLAR